MRKKIKMVQRKDRRGLYMSIIIAGIMIMSAFGVIFYGNSESGAITWYGDFKFKETNRGYMTKIDGNPYYFDLLPDNVAFINVTSGTGKKIKNAKAIVFTSDPESSYAEDIAVAQLNVGQVLLSKSINVMNSFNAENKYNLPVLNCMNASEQIPIIEIIESNVTTIKEQNNCVKMYFDTSYNLKAEYTRMIYLVLGNMND